MTSFERVAATPALSVVIPTFNNVKVLAGCLEAWQTVAADQPVEILVIEDGCTDATPDYLRTVAATPWGQRHLRWHHQDDLHELRCTNYGFRQAKGPLLLAWQDDMFLQSPWLVPELLATFATYDDLGLLCLSRGLNCTGVTDPIAGWDDLIDWRRLQSTIGPAPMNWFRLQEVDLVIRPWVVRRACVDTVGVLDEAFVPTEWDEADLSFRIRRAGWKVATHGYERLGAYHHLGSTTVGVLSDAYKQRVVRNGRLFHERWNETIRRESNRPRRTWWRRATPAGWWWSARRATRALTTAVGRFGGHA
jgi:glycosyltransferase involved in cell wall biosynthesis